MSTSPQRNPVSYSFERIHFAVDVLRQQADALSRLAAEVPADFDPAVELVLQCRGSVIVTGMGKAGWIGQKISASLASTGTRSHFLHPAEAMHGDLGRIAADDVVLVLSNSGETSEIATLLPTFHKMNVPLIAITAGPDSTLGRHADLVLNYGKVSECDHLGLAPSTSTTMMLALGDALTMTLAREREFRPQDFVKFHPGGSLGLRLSLVEEIMRPLEQCRVSEQTGSVREIYICNRSESRRSGAVMLVDELGRLTGIFTDSDLAKLLARQQDSQLDHSIANVMTKNPLTVAKGTRTEIAIETLAARNISELPVVDREGRPIGMIDITDVLSIQ